MEPLQKPDPAVTTEAHVSEDCPSAELTRDEKGMLFYRLEDFEKIFKLVFLCSNLHAFFSPPIHGTKTKTFCNRGVAKNGKITNAQVYNKYPFLYHAVEYLDDPNAKAAETGPEKAKCSAAVTALQKRKKKRKTFNFGFESTKEIELDELMKIFKDSPFQFNFPATREVFDTFLADEKNPEFVDLKKLKELMEDTGMATFGEEEDMKILIEALDKDKDGKLSYKDLLYNIPYHQYSPAEVAEIKKYVHLDMAAAAQKSPKKSKDKIRKKEPTCCVVNPDMLHKPS